MKKIIYDIGANNGDDIPYYLMKSEMVIAVEANPHLCDLIKARFREEIERGDLVVENYVLNSQETAEKVLFYLHKENHVLSQFPKPSKELINEFSKIELQAITPMGLFEKYGSPYYVKIDIEHFDGEILRCLFENKIYPEYISAESHDIEIFAILVALGKYNAFKIVSGESISEKYKGKSIFSLDGKISKYSFPHHSAGPFGEDIDGEWLSSESMLKKLALDGFGWKDLHATKNATGTSSYSLKEEFCKIRTKKRKDRFERFFRIAYK